MTTNQRQLLIKSVNIRPEIFLDRRVLRPKL